jgi:hypothetical protein
MKRSPTRNRSPIRFIDPEDEYKELYDIIEQKYGNGYKNILDGYHIIKFLGTGSSNTDVFEISNGIDSRAMKFIKYAGKKSKKQIQIEIMIPELLNDYTPRITTKIYRKWFYNFKYAQIAVYTMDKVDTTLDNYFSSVVVDSYNQEVIQLEFERLLDTMCELRLIHADLHMANIGINLDLDNNIKELLILDWGVSVNDKQCEPCLEISKSFYIFNKIYDMENHNSYLIANTPYINYLLQYLWNKYCPEKIDLSSYNFNRSWINYWIYVYNSMLSKYRPDLL